MAKFECKGCGYVFDEQQAGIKFSEIMECPICAGPREDFEQQAEEEKKPEIKKDDAGFVIEKRQEFWLEEKDKKPEKEPDRSNIETYYEGGIPVKTQEQLDKEAQEKEEAERPKLDPIEVTGTNILERGDSSSDGSNSEVVVVDEAASDVDTGDDEKKEEVKASGNSEGDEVKNDSVDVEEKDDDFVFEEAVESTEPLETQEIPAAVSAGIHEEGDFFTGFDNSPTFGDAVRTEEFFFDDEEPLGEAVELETAEEVVEEAAEAAEEKAEEVAEETVEAVEEKAEEVAEETAEAVEEKAEEVVEEAAEETAEAVEEKAEEVAEETAEAVEEKAEEAAEENAEAVEEKAEEVVEEVAEAAEEKAEEAAEETAEAVEEKAEEVVEEAAEEVAEEAEEKAEETAEETAEAAEEKAEEAAEETAEAVEEKVEETAEETTEVAEEKAEETAEETAEAVEEKAEEAAEETAEAVEEKAEEVAEETAEAAEEKAAEAAEEVAEAAEEKAEETAEAVEEKAEEVTEEASQELSDSKEFILIDEEETEESGTEIAEDKKYHLLTDEQVKSLFEQYGIGPASNGLEGIILLPAQLDPMPLGRDEEIVTESVIGKFSNSPVKMEQPFANSESFLWGEYVPGEDDDAEYTDAALILVKGKTSHIPTVSGKKQLRKEVASAKEKSGGKPIGLSLMIGRIEQDLAVCVNADVDFVVLNDASSGMLPYALRRAKNYLNRVNSKIEILVSIEDVNNAQEIAKLIALGADVILLKREYSETTTRRLTAELREIARNTGHKDVHGLNMYDICTIDRDLAANTDISHF